MRTTRGALTSARSRRFSAVVVRAAPRYAALQIHQPQLARAKSPIEIAFFELCEAARIPLPDLNVRMDGWLIDALWRKQCVAVELDAHGNHHTRAQMRRDRRKDLYLRSRGFTPLRYSDDQVIYHGQAVLADVLAALDRSL
jgi:hypothetical protein